VFERFTDRARRVIVLAQEEARHLQHHYIGTEHLLLGMLLEGEGAAARALNALGVRREDALREIEQIVPRGTQEPSGHVPFTPRAKKILELSLREALQLGHNYIGTEHLLLALVREGEGVGAQILPKLGPDYSAVRQEVLDELAIGGRLAPMVPEIADEIAQVRVKRERAIEANDLEQARRLRGEERGLRAELARRQDLWHASFTELTSAVEQAQAAKDAALDRGDLEEAARARGEERRLSQQLAAMEREAGPPPPFLP